jgi:hypothetical protein
VLAALIPLAAVRDWLTEADPGLIAAAHGVPGPAGFSNQGRDAAVSTDPGQTAATVAPLVLSGPGARGPALQSRPCRRLCRR